MPLVIAMILAAAYGFGIGMAVAIWLMGRDPCSDRGLPPVSMKREQYRFAPVPRAPRDDARQAVGLGAQNRRLNITREADPYPASHASTAPAIATSSAETRGLPGPLETELLE
jgi:hypothetical protein